MGNYEKEGSGIFHFSDKGLVIKGKAGSKAQDIVNDIGLKIRRT